MEKWGRSGDIKMIFNEIIVKIFLILVNGINLYFENFRKF